MILCSTRVQHLVASSSLLSGCIKVKNPGLIFLYPSMVDALWSLFGLSPLVYRRNMAEDLLPLSEVTRT